MSCREDSLAIARSATLVNLIGNTGIQARETLTIDDVMVHHPDCRSIEVARRLTPLGDINHIAEVTAYVEILEPHSLLYLEDLVVGISTDEPVNKGLELIFGRAAGHLPEADAHLAITSWNG